MKFIKPSLYLFIFILISCSKDAEIIIQHKLTVSSNPSAGGIISGNNSYNKGQIVSLLATPSAEYVFKDWSGSLSGSTNPSPITMDMDKSVVGNFEKRQYPLSLTIEGQGTIKEEIVAVATQSLYPSGTTVKLTAQPGANYEFKEWSGDLSSTVNPFSIVINKNINLKVTFVYADSDGDGVFDVKDKCSNTPIGESVDSNGCSKSQIDTYRVSMLKTYIPDDNFEKELMKLGYDDVLDDSVKTLNIRNVTILNIYQRNIASVEGIQDFTNLEELDLRTNKITQLSVAKNLNLKKLKIDNTLIPTTNYNNISSLDLSNNLKLEMLNIMDNNFNTLDVSKNINLVELRIGNNHSSTANEITTINLSQNKKLKIFTAGQMQLASIDLSNNSLITDLFLTSLPLKNIDISNLTELKTLNLGGTQIQNLNLSGSLKLEILFLLFNETNNIKSLALPKSLKSIYIRGTGLTALDLSSCLNLNSFNIEGTFLKNSNIKWGNLDSLKLFSITSQINFGNIDFAKMTNLTQLTLNSVNSIDNLDVKLHPNLNYLFLIDLPLKSLDISPLLNQKSFRATNMPSLKCIKVNQSQLDARNINVNNWFIDSGTLFSLNCN